MQGFVLLVIAVAIWYFLFRKRASSAEPKAIDVPLKVTVSTSVGRSGSTFDDRVDTGPLAVVEGGFVLNPKSPMPLTVTGISRDEAQSLKAALDRRWVDYGTRGEVAFLIARRNMRCREIDEYIAKNRANYLASIAKQKAESSEWASASEKDRADLAIEFGEKALSAIKYLPSDTEALKVLLNGEPADITADDDLAALFGSDVEGYKLFVYALSSAGAVRTVSADDGYRKRYEGFVEKGLARRGADIPVSDILESLRMKDINDALHDLIPKPFGRKAKAIEYALSVPDIKDRLSKIVSFRELFQVLVPGGVDAAAVRQCFAHAVAVATVFCETYTTGAYSLNTIAERKDCDFDHYFIVADNCCPECAAQYHDKKYKAKPAKVPPYHVGCNCNLEGGYD